MDRGQEGVDIRAHGMRQGLGGRGSIWVYVKPFPILDCVLHNPVSFCLPPGSPPLGCPLLLATPERARRRCRQFSHSAAKCLHRGWPNTASASLWREMPSRLVDTRVQGCQNKPKSRDPTRDGKWVEGVTLSQSTLTRATNLEDMARSHLFCPVQWIACGCRRMSANCWWALVM